MTPSPQDVYLALAGLEPYMLEWAGPHLRCDDGHEGRRDHATYEYVSTPWRDYVRVTVYPGGAIVQADLPYATDPEDIQACAEQLLCDALPTI